MKKSLISYSVFLYILLGALTAFGPLVTDMYLPALPGMANYFTTTTSMVQLGLTTSMIGLAVGQLRTVERQVRPTSAAAGIDAGVHRLHPALHLLSEH